MTTKRFEAFYTNGFRKNGVREYTLSFAALNGREKTHDRSRDLAGVAAEKYAEETAQVYHYDNMNVQTLGITVEVYVDALSEEENPVATYDFKVATELAVKARVIK